jgi:signal transduction histidine kinase
VVFAALAVLLAQTLTIVALLAQRRNRRLAEADATARRGELARAARFATVGELSASIAHEVGQPLGAILSNADAAELLVKASHVDRSELEDILSDVKRDALRANDVVQRLRSLLQKQGVAFEPLQLEPMLQCALKLVAPEAKRRNISLETNYDAADAEIMGDVVQLQQVVLNLAINAMDAMQDTVLSSRVLTIGTRQRASGVEFTVADRGCGIGSASARRLFEPFYTTKPHGMGLGLSIVRSIVEAHDGHVDAAAREGGGTVFTVWLPCTSAATHTLKTYAPYARPSAQTLGRTEGAAQRTSS